MTESRRNIAVGLTVLVALAGLGFMILLFGELPEFLRGGYPIYMEFPASGGVTPGTDVHLNGVAVGRITEVRFRDDPRQGVVFTARIDSDYRIPGDVMAFIYTKGFVGGSWVELTSQDGVSRPHEWLPAGYTIQDGKNKGSGLIPDELMQKVDEIVASFDAFGQLANNLNQLIAPLTPTASATAPTTHMATTTASAPTLSPTTEPAGLQGTLSRLNRTLDAFNAVFGDVEAQQNVKVTLTNLRIASDQGAKAMQELSSFAAEARQSLKQIDSAAVTVRDRVDALSVKLIQQADNLGRLLSTLNQLATKLEQGEGSAGQFLNDPKLYNNLVGASQQLQRTLQELQATIEQWRTEGARIKLK